MLILMYASWLSPELPAASHFSYMACGRDSRALSKFPCLSLPLGSHHLSLCSWIYLSPPQGHSEYRAQPVWLHPHPLHSGTLQVGRRGNQ